MLTGITEPIEFTFLFVAPLMYAVHCVYAGLSFMLMHIFNVGVGMTFSGGLIDLTLFGIMQGNAKTSWIWVVIVGVVYFFLYYFTFYFMITKMDLKTPGREDDDEETKLFTRADFKAKTGVGPDAAGGAGAIKDQVSALTVENEALRIRAEKAEAEVLMLNGRNRRLEKKIHTNFENSSLPSSALPWLIPILQNGNRDEC
jgi:PTS system D-glucosamine-specific IIC component